MIAVSVKLYHEYRRSGVVYRLSLFVIRYPLKPDHLMKKFQILCMALLLTACADRKSEIESAMNQYDKLAFRMNADSIADSYLLNGILSGKGMGKFVGRNSIR